MVVLRVGIAVAAATVGGIIGVVAKHVSHKALCGLVSFAAGALLSVTALHIMPEAIELSGLVPGVTSLAIGVLLFYLIGKYVSYICPACAASVMDRRATYLRLGILLMVALGIHSTIDGLAIIVGAEATPLLGILVLFAVSYHKIPEGLALASVARLAGFSRPKALIVTILIELTTALGAFIGLLVAEQGLSHYWLGIILAHAGGSFLYVVGFALFTELQEHEKMPIIVYLLIGFLTMSLLAVALRPAFPALH